MTPALKKMVEAMIAELDRQEDDVDDETLHRAGGYVSVYADGELTTIDGKFDMEKVARAGLEAIKEQVIGVGRILKDEPEDGREGRN